MVDLGMDSEGAINNDMMSPVTLLLSPNYGNVEIETRRKSEHEKRENDGAEKKKSLNNTSSKI